MATEIRNVSVDPLTLPNPLQGTLKGGEAIVLSTATATLLALIPSLGSSFQVRDLGSGYSGETHDTEFGLDTSEAETFSNKTLTTCSLGSALICGSNDITGVGILTSQVVRGAVANLSLRPAVAGGSVEITKADGTTKAIESNATGLGFYGVAPVARQVLATGGGATADNIITALQALGLLAQS